MVEKEGRTQGEDRSQARVTALTLVTYNPLCMAKARGRLPDVFIALAVDWRDGYRLPFDLCISSSRDGIWSTGWRGTCADDPIPNGEPMTRYMFRKRGSFPGGQCGTQT